MSRPRYLLTPSLLRAWRYMWSKFNKYGNEADGRREKACEEFLTALRKGEQSAIKSSWNSAELRKLIIKTCTGNRSVADHIWGKAAHEIARKVGGGQFEVKVSKPIEVDGMEFLLCGRADCLKAGEVSAIEFNNRYEAGEYFDSPYHAMYMELVPEAQRFVYHISNGMDVFEEAYSRSECRPAQEIIAEFINYLRTSNLIEAYKAKWHMQQR